MRSNNIRVFFTALQLLSSSSSSSSSFSTMRRSCFVLNRRCAVTRQAPWSLSQSLSPPPPPPPSTSSSSSSFSFSSSASAAAASTAASEAPLDLSIQGAAATQRNTDPKAVCVVTGASRGLGLEFTRQLLQRTRGVVVAACRGGEGATSPGLAALRAEYAAANGSSARLSILDLDLASQESIDGFAVALRSRHGGRVDLLLNVAGILHDAAAAPKAPERALAHVKREWLQKTLEVNTMGPLMLTQALEPMLKLPRDALKKKQHLEEGEGAPARPPSVVASVSARVGSIADNGLGGWYSYRISKAALNMATVNMALELKRSGVWCVALHPGTTDTDLSKPFQKNVKPEKLFSPEFSVGQMLGVVEALQQHHTGGFFAWDGQRIEY